LLLPSLQRRGKAAIETGNAEPMSALAATIRQKVLKLNYRLSVKSRERKFDLFWNLMKPQPGWTVLNLGAAPPHLADVLSSDKSDSDVEQPEQDPRWRQLRVIGLNLNREDMRRYRVLYPDFGAVIGDGCRLPFADKSIDCVFSNAVIEHMLPEQQKTFAREIMRVGRSWFVTTPNFWYPIELHHKLPFIQFLPQRAQRAVSARFNTCWPSDEPIYLLSARRLKELLPGSRVFKLRVTFFPETLIAFSNNGAAAG
jgi:hypothetical protein